MGRTIPLIKWGLNYDDFIIKEHEIESDIKNNMCPSCGANLKDDTCNFCGNYYGKTKKNRVIPNVPKKDRSRF